MAATGSTGAIASSFSAPRERRPSRARNETRPGAPPLNEIKEKKNSTGKKCREKEHGEEGRIDNKAKQTCRLPPPRVCAAAAPPRSPSRHNAGPAALFNSVAAFGGHGPATTGVTVVRRGPVLRTGGELSQRPVIPSVALCCCFFFFFFLRSQKKKKKR